MHSFSEIVKRNAENVQEKNKKLFTSDFTFAVYPCGSCRTIASVGVWKIATGSVVLAGTAVTMVSYWEEKGNEQLLKNRSKSG